MAARGANVVALDALKKLYIGLETADVYLDERGVYFDRVQADMQALPFADGSFDLVFTTASAHHAEDMAILLSEVYRVLREGGQFVLVNEPVSWPGDTPAPEIEDGVNETMIGAGEWMRFFEGGGFVTEKCRAKGGRNLNCVLTKREDKNPITDKLKTTYNRVKVVSSSGFWRWRLQSKTVARARKVYSKLK
jgi:ubiquinone/menaquinone biosynthesis C-methylase UbiE